MKHICIDARMINNSGIGVYIRYFINSLLADARMRVTILGRKVELDAYFDLHTFNHIEADFPIYSITEQLKLPRLIPVCDVFWSPHYNVPILPFRARKFLVTIPDVFHLAFYNTLSLPQKIYAKVVMNAAVRKADRILTISNYSKNEIIQFTSVHPDKIDVIYLGLDRDLFHSINAIEEYERVRTKYNTPQKYILFVGNVKPNKNLKTLVSAFRLLLDKLPEYQLLIVGKKEGFINSDDELFSQVIEDPELNNRVAFTGYVDLADLPILYSMASLFAFPSLYEGFGFPPLEAMACGCPVVASDRASIPEICGEAALYIDPAYPQQLADAIYQVISNEPLKESLVKKGYEQVEHYDWTVAGRSFIRQINSLIE
ncbi:glycosyltransferase [Spirosoma sp. HMF3257]|uniref:Glycosyltransferase family 1 protein n=1 Tax=Spirosoma telluris TaxID=2183553 RepID=A0A327NMS0_9BACT|nr:glycosyltransferase [Spirosoma telluris]RAI76093.1 glycosyltransferase family 1 protein [Spirosoma telluris]